MPQSDKTLIQQAQAGNRTAFARLYERYYQPVYTRIYYRVLNQATAEDLTAKVFVQMVEKIDRFHDRGHPFLAWLHTITRHILVDYYRLVEHDAQVPLDEQLTSTGDNPVSFTELRLATDCLERAMHQLTDIQQEVIIGKFMEERTNSELAALLGKNEGSIKSLQHRALDTLRRMIMKEGCYEA